MTRVVLDANILIRAVLGPRVRWLLREYSSRVEFFAPDSAFHEASKYLPNILAARNIPIAPAMAILDLLTRLVQIVAAESYSAFEAVAHERIDRRDSGDWPVLASALLLDCAIWTEDADFFGCGVATWTTDRIELLLKRQPEES